MKFLKNKYRFLFLVMLVFVFVASSAMAISKGSVLESEIAKYMPVKEEKDFPQNPVLINSSFFPTLSAQGAIAIDLDSGITLYEKNADAKLFPASTTKIVTAMVAMETYKLSDVLIVPKKATSVVGQKMGLVSGERMTFENLLYGLLVYSANDAAETLAYNYPNGGYDGFISAMNEKAYNLSMKNSHFDNPVGLDTTSQRSTAKDLLRASEVAMRDPVFGKIVGTKNIIVRDETGKIPHNLKNINELLGTTPGVLGVKTGWTENARENLVTYLERDNHKIIVTVLGSQDRFGETKELIDWIFKNYEWQKVKPTSVTELGKTQGQ